MATNAPVTLLLGLHAAQTSAARLLGFAVPVIFVALGDGVASTFPLATLSTVTSAVKLIALPLVGGIADRVSLTRATVLTLLGQLSGAVACFVFTLAPVQNIDVHSRHIFSSSVTLVAVALLTASAELLKDFTSIVLEMRVAPALLADSDAAGLPKLNSLVKRVELAAKFVTPFAFGWLASRLGSAPRTLATYACAVLVILACTTTTLWKKLLATKLTSAASNHQTASAADTPPIQAGLVHLTASACPVAGMTLAFALLFCTVLDDHNPVATAYFAAHGVTAGVLGTARSVGALMGMLGTLFWPILERRFGLLPGAAIALWLFIFAIAPVTPSLKWSPYAALALITSSRVFLWSFDLAMVSVLQKLVHPSKRGAWAGAQAVVCQLMELAISSLAVAWSGRGGFSALARVSFLTVLSAGLIFTACAVLHARRRISPNIPVEHYHTL
eukprot:TRINITY_DN69218_c0_g1_i1.p1 TRINITY_DN69218_c0_g1~~TRINITY_DN69218_c0_g1_i1.p1  ORF type:complete len:462 (-),score=46.96 TRINITY_DN69218_c0_g1_i1:104-1438(-)